MKLRRIALLVIMIALATVTSTQPALATDRHAIASHKWRAEVRSQLKRHHIYSKARENTIINIIAHESTGNQNARNGVCVGLLQFNSGWKHNYSQHYFKKHHIRGYRRDNRLSGSWSIHRIVMVYKQGGNAAVKRHWAATYRR